MTSGMKLPAGQAVGRLTVSLVMPCWRDEARVLEFAACWAGCGEGCEVIVAFGPEGSWSAEALAGLGATVVVSDRLGRGMQMNAGAAVAGGEVLLFHHADSDLTVGHVEALRLAMARDEVVGGAFYRAFDMRHPSLRWLEPLERFHCRAFGTLYGDQSVFVRREVFQRLGGFADFPIMEDVEFSRRLRGAGPVVVVDPPMFSSPRKHLEDGPWRTTLRNAVFLFLYHCGVPPAWLHDRYYAARRRFHPTT